MVTRGLSVNKVVVDGAQEPVTLELLKSHLAIDFEDHDDLLELLAVKARQAVEFYTGLSLIDTNVTARWECLTSRPLPYGPVKSITSVQDKDEVTITTHALEGQEGGQMSITAYLESPVVVKYLAGYEFVPEGLVVAIIKHASDDFTNRTGISLDNNVASQRLPNDWKSAAKPYRVMSWLA